MLKLKDYLLTDNYKSIVTNKTIREKRLTEPFLRGPIPMRWLNESMAISGTATKIGLYLWHISGMNNQNLIIKLNKKLINEFNVSRQTRYRAFQALENAGLLTIEQKNGRYPEITLIC